MTEPDAPSLEWAAGVVGPGATIAGVRSLRREGCTWELTFAGGGVDRAVLKWGPAGDWRESYVTEAAGLELAAAQGVAVPRVLGVDLDHSDRSVALLIGWIDGASSVPEVASVERLREVGRSAARIHAVPLEPSDVLPLRERHTAWTDFALWRREGKDPSTTLLDEADRRVREAPKPDAPTVFVHGDLWQGNTMWDGDRCIGLIDWETAGAGHAGVDLGCLRWDAAVLFGASAPDEISRGWSEVAGREPDSLAYWDLVSALNVPSDAGRLAPSFAEAGRADLDGQTIRERHKTFLEDALHRL